MMLVKPQHSPSGRRPQAAEGLDSGRDGPVHYASRSSDSNAPMAPGSDLTSLVENTPSRAPARRRLVLKSRTHAPECPPTAVGSARPVLNSVVGFGGHHNSVNPETTHTHTTQDHRRRSALGPEGISRGIRALRTVLAFHRANRLAEAGTRRHGGVLRHERASQLSQHNVCGHW